MLLLGNPGILLDMGGGHMAYGIWKMGSFLAKRSNESILYAPI